MAHSRQASVGVFDSPWTWLWVIAGAVLLPVLLVLIVNAWQRGDDSARREQERALAQTRQGFVDSERRVADERRAKEAAWQRLSPEEKKAEIARVQAFQERMAERERVEREDGYRRMEQADARVLDGVPAETEHGRKDYEQARMLRNVIESNMHNKKYGH